MNNQLREELLQSAKIQLAKFDKHLSWLRFAKKTNYGYRFLAHREAQWDVLKKIAQEVHGRFPDMTEGQVVDALCDIVNAG
jgi:hypothetical protein